MRFEWFVCALCYVVFVRPCLGQTRWCTVTGTRDPKPLVYPPIARAAHVSGAVIERVTFQPGGGVSDVEVVLGPPLLEQYLHAELKQWIFSTDATGIEPCQALVIVDFLFKSASEPGGPKFPTSLYRIAVRNSNLEMDAAMPTVEPKR